MSDFSRLRKRLCDAAIHAETELMSAREAYEASQDAFSDYLSAGDHAACERVWPKLEQQRRIVEELRNVYESIVSARDHLDAAVSAPLGRVF